MSIRALLSKADGSDREPDLRESPLALSDDELLWIDVTTDDDDDDVPIVRAALGLDHDVVAALGADLTTPTASVLTNAVQLVLLWFDDERDDPVGLQVVAADGWVITRHPQPLNALDALRRKVTDQRALGSLRAVEFVFAILDRHVDGLFAVAEQLERAVDRLDEEALSTDRDLLGKLVEMRKRIARARRIATAHADVYAEVNRPDFMPELEERDDRVLARSADRFERAVAAIATVREMLIGTFDVHATRTAQRTNDIMRILTWTSVILLPAVVVAGIMGMNFEVWLFDRTELFWVVVGFMLLTAVSTLLIARRKGWL